MDKSFVMTLSAPWGSGKKFFLNAWRNEITWNGEENVDKIPCVYFSAWEYDCVDDPLLAIVGKMQEDLNNVLTKNGKNKLVKLGKIARSLATKENLSKWGLKTINKLVKKMVGDDLDVLLEQSSFDKDFAKEDLQELLKDLKNAFRASPEKKLQAVLKEKNYL